MSERFLRRREVESLTGYSRSVIYDKMARGEFPKAVRTGPKAVRWLESEIVGWQNARINGEIESSSPPMRHPGQSKPVALDMLRLHISSDLKSKLDEAARSAGRTATQEAIIRLDMSFDREALVEAMTTKLLR